MRRFVQNSGKTKPCRIDPRASACIPREFRFSSFPRRIANRLFGFTEASATVEISILLIHGRVGLWDIVIFQALAGLFLPNKKIELIRIEIGSCKVERVSILWWTCNVIIFVLNEMGYYFVGTWFVWLIKGIGIGVVGSCSMRGWREIFVRTNCFIVIFVK